MNTIKVTYTKAKEAHELATQNMQSELAVNHTFDEYLDARDKHNLAQTGEALRNAENDLIEWGYAQIKKEHRTLAAPAFKEARNGNPKVRDEVIELAYNYKS